MIKYVLYEGEGGAILFTRQEKVQANPDVAKPFGGSPTWSCDASDDSAAIGLLNEYLALKNKGKV